MTIAACYVAPEGVVLGADSTTTFDGAPAHHYNYAQKIFEVGNGSTLGAVTWGIGSFKKVTSYRTLFAEFADQIAVSRPLSMPLMALEFAEFLGNAYSAVFAEEQLRAMQVAQKLSKGEALSDEEQTFALSVPNYAGGVCLAGHLGGRTPEAFKVTFSLLGGTPTVAPVGHGPPSFWGMPDVIHRVIWGFDPAAFDAIKATGKWTGSDEELALALVSQRMSAVGYLPLREAIDWVHASIYTTIKAMKFSQFSPVCGGPIEIAVVSSDRPFRWVRHKPLDAALDEID